MMTIKRHDYETREALAEGLAAGVAAVLAGGIATRGQAVLAVSGGSTPKRLFQLLSQTQIDWEHVTIVLVDERYVPETHERSNAALVRQNLMRGPAALARLEPFFEEGFDARQAAPRIAPRLAVLPRPFDVAILGMGTDGHTASFFPGADRLAEALDPEGAEPIIAIEAPGAGEPRLTLTLPWLADARLLALHIEGEEKRAVLERALEPGPAEDLPVRAILNAPREQPLQVFWAP